MSNATNAANFLTSLRTFAGKDVPAAVERFHREIQLELLRRIVLGSPVGNRQRWKINQGRNKRNLLPKGNVGGQFRGAWQLSLGSPSTQDIRTPKGGRPRPPIDASQAKQVLSSLKPFTVSYLVNNLPYAAVLNEGRPKGTPWTKIKQLGWIETAVAEVAQWASKRQEPKNG